jgi:hypothetical protein
MDKVSDVQEVAELVNQRITFVGGVKLSYRGVIAGSIEQGIFTHMKMQDGRTIMINPANVLAIEITKHE